jgi:hypothetical protein
VLPTFDVFGGHPPPAPFITMKHVFPNLLYLDYEPANIVPEGTVWNSYAFDIEAPGSCGSVV